MTLGENFFAALRPGAIESVNAGLGGEVERLLHLVERRRDSALLQAFMDEHQEFMLFARQHRGPHGF